MIIILERAAISTTVLEGRYMVVGGGLRGEKWVGIIPLLPAPTIMHYHKGTTQGRMKEGASKYQLALVN
jgi:hypothetical protein